MAINIEKTSLPFSFDYKSAKVNNKNSTKERILNVIGFCLALSLIGIIFVMQNNMKRVTQELDNYGTKDLVEFSNTISHDISESLYNGELNKISHVKYNEVAFNKLNKIIDEIKTNKKDIQFNPKNVLVNAEIEKYAMSMNFGINHKVKIYYVERMIVGDKVVPLNKVLLCDIAQKGYELKVTNISSKNTVKLKDLFMDIEKEKLLNLKTVTEKDVYGY